MGCGKWVRSPAGAFVGGNDADGQKTYIIRATQVADLCPSQLSHQLAMPTYHILAENAQKGHTR